MAEQTEVRTEGSQLSRINKRISLIERNKTMNISKQTMVFTITVVFVVVLGCMATDTKATVTHTFTSVTEQMMDLRVTSFASLQDEPFEITNSTGVTWIDFHVTLEGFGEFSDYPFMRFTDLGSDGVIYTGPGTASFSDDNADGLGYDEVMHVDGLNVPDGSVLSFTVDILGGVIPEGLVEFSIYGLPSVPEPCTILVLGIGALVLGGCARRKRIRQ